MVGDLELVETMKWTSCVYKNHLSGRSSTFHPGNTFFTLCTPTWLKRLDLCNFWNQRYLFNYLIWVKSQSFKTSSTADGLTIYLLRTPCFHFLLLSLSTKVNCLHGKTIQNPFLSSLSKSKHYVGNTLHQAPSFVPCLRTSTQKNFDLDCKIKHVVAEPIFEEYKYFLPFDQLLCTKSPMSVVKPLHDM